MLDHKQPIETGSVPKDGSQFDVIVVEVARVVPRQQPSTR